MRIAILADIHGNLPAFEAALDHANQQAPNALIIAGDIVNGCPDSRACWDLALSLNCPILRGNHERYVAHYDSPNAPPEWKTERFSPVRWSASQFSKPELDLMGALPASLKLPDFPELVFCHSSLRGDSDLIAAFTPDHQIEGMFPGLDPELPGWVIRGHNHTPAIRIWGRQTLVTAGSVGLAQDGIPTAQYVTLTGKPGGWEVAHQSVEYNIKQTTDRFAESGYLHEAGVMARLFRREVETASFQIVPFLKLFHRMAAEAGVEPPLSEVFERFKVW